MKSIEELALKVAKEMYPDWHHDVTSRLLPAYATRLLATYTEQQEPVGEVQHMHELNDNWLQNLPVGTKLYAALTGAEGVRVEGTVMRKEE
jgi:hypothetical protein